ncbi:hypothetical protein AL504_31795 [Achromobacter xylosoxidans]|uniref:Uncharacterized protein n=1 Tax=Alcaligenes xylosoxydans xylosoxydans TaxID=85698 RepID=A0A2L0PU42_ALCXX|nr:hypothetical protein AL504_31795 [Achromobacter xylosoxidans]
MRGRRRIVRRRGAGNGRWRRGRIALGRASRAFAGRGRRRHRGVRRWHAWAGGRGGPLRRRGRASSGGAQRHGQGAQRGGPPMWGV